MSNIDSYVTKCQADMKMINFLLDTINDYQNILIPRHHKFVDTYIHYKRNLKMVSVIHGFNEKEIKSIFWRIQRKLLIEFIELAGANKVTVATTPENFDSFLLWQLKQFRDDADAVFEFIKNRIVKKFNIDGVTKNKQEEIEYVLRMLSTYKDLNTILPEKAYIVAKDLLDGLSFTEVIEKHDRNKKYLLISIIGKPNPRSKAERGWLAYLGDEATKNIVEKQVKIEKEKVIQFPTPSV